MNNYTDGKSRSKKEVRESLASLLNHNSNNPFRTTDKSSFINMLKSMTMEEKGLLCNKVGVRPVINGGAAIMDSNLVRAFDDYIANQPIYLQDREQKMERKVDYNNPPESLKELL